MGSLADDVMLGKDVLLMGGLLGVARVSSFPCSLWEIVPVASLKVLVDSIVLIFSTRLGVCLARIKHWEMQKLSLPLMSKAADCSTSTILLRASLRQGLRKPDSRASGGLWVGPAVTAGQAAERSLMARVLENRHCTLTVPSEEFTGTHRPLVCSARGCSTKNNRVWSFPPQTEPYSLPVGWRLPLVQMSSGCSVALGYLYPGGREHPPITTY